jgi:hypothetical protein
MTWQKFGTLFVHSIDMNGTHDILTTDNFGTMFASTLASNNLNSITMRTKMTFIMTALQASSVLLASLDLGCANLLAFVCFLAATLGVLAAQALNN